MRTAVNPFPRGSWIACNGRLLGVLDRNLIQGPQLIDTSVRIPVILPDDWESIQQSSLTAHNTTPLRPSTIPTTPRSTGPQGITSWNPFSSPVGGQNTVTNKQKNPARPRKHLEHEATEPSAILDAPSNSTTTNAEPVLTISSSDTGRTDDGSDTEQLLEDQLAPVDTTPTKKRKKQTSPEPIRSKRSTAGKKRARLDD